MDIFYPPKFCGFAAKRDFFNLSNDAGAVKDWGTRGAINALAENGFTDGKTIVIYKFNPHGDISVGNSIAKEMVEAPGPPMVPFLPNR